jgi:hypothetical protein
MRPRDTYRHILREGRYIVMYGVTVDPEAREAEHRRNHPRAVMTIEHPAVTAEAALAWERTMIEQYCQRTAGESRSTTRSSFSKAVENALPLLVFAMLVNQAAVQGVKHVVRAFEVEEERIEVRQQEAALEKHDTTATIRFT